MPDAKLGLQILDQFFIYFHLLLTLFNMFGWAWWRIRRLHLVTVGLTAGSWLGLGIWYGIGYCPLTDWHWQVRESLGKGDMPASYVKFMIDYFTGLDVNSQLVDWGVGIWFTCAVVLSLALNFRDHRKHQK